MTLLREAIGESLRHARTAQSRTLREVSTSARVSLGYLSEVERGRKEASSELLAAICQALEVPLSQVLSDVSIALTDPAATPHEPAAGERAVPVAAPAPADSVSDTAGTSRVPAVSAFGRIAGQTRIVIPAPSADKLVLVPVN